MPITRREFLAAAGAAGALAATSKLTGVAEALPPTLPPPHLSGIEHVVFVCMENRSFDHYLGWAPQANGMQAGLSYLDDLGVPHSTHQLTEWTGCGFNDPGHNYAQGRAQYNGGAIDGFMKSASGNDTYALGYFGRSQVPTNSAFVDNFTICDNYFSSILGPTYPNRFYTHAAQTDRIENTIEQQSFLPTIWDGLQAAGLSCNYYFSDLPFLGLWWDKYLHLGRRVEQFFADAALGTLPKFSYIDPFFLGEEEGGSNDDHPHADIRRGQNFLARVANAVMSGPKWNNTVLVITYDEWGGFFDHVVPPTLPDSFVPTPTEEHNTAGFRVPTYVVSPFAKKGKVSHVQFDHTSLLKMIEWRWGLAPLAARDAAANNLALALDLNGYHNPTTSIPTPPDPGPDPCIEGQQLSSVTMGNSDDFWEELKASPFTQNWQRI